MILTQQAANNPSGYKIVFSELGKAELKQYSVPEPTDNQVLVKVAYTLISNGTEKACLLGSENTIQKFPQFPGYSSVGTVIKTGKNVKTVSEGDRVFVEYGGHASYNVKSSQYVYKIPNNVEFTEAVFVKLASYPLLALRRSRLEMGESVVIVGLGMLGLFGVQLAKIGGGIH